MTCLVCGAEARFAVGNLSTREVSLYCGPRCVLASIEDYQAGEALEGVVLWSQDVDEAACARCGCSWGQHSKGVADGVYCRHCPCPAWQPREPGPPEAIEVPDEGPEDACLNPEATLEATAGQPPGEPSHGELLR